MRRSLYNWFDQRPRAADCDLCKGWGITGAKPLTEEISCSACCGTGMDMVPWTELFSTQGSWWGRNDEDEE